MYYHCPFCNCLSGTLDPLGIDSLILLEKQVVGGGKRKGKCPSCKASDREKLVYLYLKYEEQLFKNIKKSILHVAPEEALSRRLKAARFSEYICCDKYQDGYEYPPYVLPLDILNLPFQNSHFDLIICNHVLEHIPDDLRAMKELLRVLNRGGKAILQVPISNISETTIEEPACEDPQERLKKFGQMDHVRIYGQDYLKRLKQTGFKVQRVSIYNKFPHAGLNPLEDIFIGIKST